jgi:hypothetical protein
VSETLYSMKVIRDPTMAPDSWELRAADTIHMGTKAYVELEKHATVVRGSDASRVHNTKMLLSNLKYWHENCSHADPGYAAFIGPWIEKLEKALTE